MTCLNIIMLCQATGYLDEYLTSSHFLFIPINVDSVLIEKFIPISMV